ncbi:hypothetical protein [Clostridium gasigenes]|uniref:hypothetical protein n=1 Tax=Clostridium gasigenes TaxID=94869 RepID=UPI001C0BF343|nr:hypothetical protein [Clostridium gasigenes]MBU3105151.1 hypothetical protein [Clostridium gasigenes]
MYKFIEELEGKFLNNVIFSFERFEDIEILLREQWAGLFSNYLSFLRNKQDEAEIINSISKLEMVTEQMNKMINEVGKKILNGDDEYTNIISEQRNKFFKYYATEMIKNFNVNSNTFYNFDESIEIANFLLSNYLEKDKDNITEDKKSKYCSIKKEFITKLNDEIKTITDKLVLISIDYYKTYKIYQEDIKPLINNEDSYKEDFVKCLASEIEINFAAF